MQVGLAARLGAGTLPAFRLWVEGHRLLFKQPVSTSRGMLREQMVYYIHCQHEGGHGVGEVCPTPQLSPEYRADFLPLLEAACRQVEKQGYLAADDFAQQSSLRFGMEGALLTSLSPQPWGDLRQELQGLKKHHLIWAGEAANQLAQMEQGAKSGLPCFKMRVGALPWAEDLDLLREARRLYPEKEIRVDANGSFSPEEAMAKLEALSELGIASIEQPLAVGLWTEMAALITHSPLAIALDEELITCHSHDERSHLLDSLKPHAIVIKPSLHGGLTAAEDWLKLSAEYGTNCWVNSYLESNVGLNLLSQWAAAHLPNTLHGLGTGQLYRNNKAI